MTLEQTITASLAGDLLARIQARAFVIHEEEGAILANRPAENSAELVALIFRSRFIRGRKIIPLIQRAIAEKFKRLAVELIATSLSRDIHDGGV